MTGPRHILIVGGGASGTILAAHLLRDGPPGLRLTLIERRERLGRGIAYDTPHAAHLLNTRVGAMSAFADRPDHFHDWLSRNGTPADRDAFVPRHLYAAYLESLVAEAPLLRREQEECVALIPGSRGRIVAHLADGRTILADRAVLATGHPLLQAGADALERAEFDPWHAPLPADAESRVLIVGTGLTMVDRVMRLLEAGHRGEIVILSRRGLLPRVNGPSKPIELDRADLPLGAGAGYALRWLRAQVRWHEGRGGDWRDIVDGARGHLALWWQSVPPETRGRFLRHARRFWEIHRHRIPAPVAARLDTARLAGQVRLLTGHLIVTTPRPGGHSVTLRHRGGGLEMLDVAQITDGRGLLRDPEDHATPLFRALVKSGVARIDALRIGLEVTAEGRVLPRAGTPPAPLYAIGPAARAASWEGLAIVDIRAQAAQLLPRLTAPETSEQNIRQRPCG